jgi:hypothetical protein
MWHLAHHGILGSAIIFVSCEYPVILITTAAVAAAAITTTITTITTTIKMVKSDFSTIINNDRPIRSEQVDDGRMASGARIKHGCPTALIKWKRKAHEINISNTHT